LAHLNFTICKDTTTLAAIRKMSSPEQSSTEKKNDKTRETCRRGPEDGYPFIVDEVFVSSYQLIQSPCADDHV
jgi:hypothetical protein